MTSRRALGALVLLAAALVLPARVAALGTRLSEIRTIGGTIRAAIDVRDMFPDNLRDVLQQGGTLYVRVQSELWEDRPMWDRLVKPAAVTVFRIVRDRTGGQVSVTDAVGPVGSFPDYPEMLPLRVDVAAETLVSDGGKYYLRLITTIGTLAERDIEDTGDAVFGRDDGTVSIARVGKLLFNAVLQVTDYLQSVSTEVRSRAFAGRELRTGITGLTE
jgi:hypothetical protein